MGANGTKPNEQTITPKLDKILDEIEGLKEAADLLNTIYLEYSFEHTIKDETWRKLQDFMGFDDSE